MRPSAWRVVPPFISSSAPSVIISRPRSFKSSSTKQNRVDPRKLLRCFSSVLFKLNLNTSSYDTPLDCFPRASNALPDRHFIGSLTYSARFAPAKSKSSPALRGGRNRIAARRGTARCDAQTKTVLWFGVKRDHEWERQLAQCFPSARSGLHTEIVLGAGPPLR